MRVRDFFKPDVGKLKKNRDVKGLLKALDHKDGEVQKEVITALEELGDFAKESLIHVIQDYDSDIRIYAAEALGRIKKYGVAILRGGLVKFVNKRVTKINGYPKRSLIGKQFINFVSPTDRNKVIERYKKRISYEWVPPRYEIEILSKDGINIPVEINASLIEYEGRPADLVILKVIENLKMEGVSL
jgi:PAS domain S-box-containing protein